MAADPDSSDVPLPKTWPANVKSLILQAISLARFAIVHTRSWASDSVSNRVRLRASLERAQAEISSLQDDLRIKDARMSRLDPSRRPHYRPVERFQILELRAAKGWSTAQTARRFQVEPDTIASWMKRVDEDGPSALVQTREPVNRFPSFVRHIVRRLKVLCPTLGKKRMAQMLAQTGFNSRKRQRQSVNAAAFDSFVVVRPIVDVDAGMSRDEIWPLGGGKVAGF